MQMHHPNNMWRGDTSSSIKPEKDGEKRQLIICGRGCKHCIHTGLSGRQVRLPFPFPVGPHCCGKFAAKRLWKGKCLLGFSTQPWAAVMQTSPQKSQKGNDYVNCWLFQYISWKNEPSESFIVDKQEIWMWKPHSQQHAPVSSRFWAVCSLSRITISIYTNRACNQKPRDLRIKESPQKYELYPASFRPVLPQRDAISH